jgi:hypothetical protein
MKRRLQILPAIFLLGLIRNLIAGQVPHLAETPDIPLGSHDRVYTADQTSNTVSVYDPSGNRLVGVLRLGDVTPQNLSPLYRGQLVPTGEGLDHLEPLAEAGLSAHLLMGTPGASAREAPTTVTLNNQGLIDLLQAAVTGLKPKTTYLLALVEDREDPNAANL